MDIQDNKRASLSKTQGFCILSVLICLATAACSKSTLRARMDGVAQKPILSQNFALPPQELKREVFSYLKAHHSKLGPFKKHPKSGEIVSAWVQAPSLRYYDLELSTRSPLPSLYQVRWKTHAHGKGSKLELSVRELLFTGSRLVGNLQEQELPRPNPKSSLWHRAPLDPHRATRILSSMLYSSPRLGKSSIGGSRSSIYWTPVKSGMPDAWRMEKSTKKVDQIQKRYY